MSDKAWDNVLGLAGIIIFSLVITGAVLVFNSLNRAGDSATFEYRNYQVEQCIKSEQYTRDECIQLVSGGGAR